MKSELIWYRDIQTFLHPERASKIWFKKSDSIETKLNNILRFSIYYTLILAIVSRKSWSILVTFTVAMMTFVLYETNFQSVHGDANNNNVDAVGNQKTRTLNSAKINTNIPVSKTNAPGIRYPTINNPYMNNLVLDTDPKRKERISANAANTLSPDVVANVRQLHDAGVPRDVSDIFGRNTSDRTFYTMPVTDIVNDQTNFAKWLFRPNDDISFKERGVLFNQ